jgi:hypothetical protein
MPIYRVGDLVEWDTSGSKSVEFRYGMDASSITKESTVGVILELDADSPICRVLWSSGTLGGRIHWHPLKEIITVSTAGGEHG